MIKIGIIKKLLKDVEYNLQILNEAKDSLISETEPNISIIGSTFEDKLSVVLSAIYVIDKVNNNNISEGDAFRLLANAVRNII